MIIKIIKITDDESETIVEYDPTIKITTISKKCSDRTHHRCNIQLNDNLYQFTFNNELRFNTFINNLRFMIKTFNAEKWSSINIIKKDIDSTVTHTVVLDIESI